MDRRIGFFLGCLAVFALLATIVLLSDFGTEYPTTQEQNVWPISIKVHEMNHEVTGSVSDKKDVSLFFNRENLSYSLLNNGKMPLNITGYVIQARGAVGWDCRSTVYRQFPIDDVTILLPHKKMVVQNDTDMFYWNNYGNEVTHLNLFDEKDNFVGKYYV